MKRNKSKMSCKRGFTLIELLVVVLIIGILAVVAVPQYQKAVLKSRASTILGILSGLVQAEEVYSVANGQYTADIRLLDVGLSGECTLNEVEGYTEGSVWSCNNDFMVIMNNTGTVAQALYCPNANTGSVDECLSNAVFQLGFGASGSGMSRVPANTRRCWIPGASTKGREDVCKALGKPVACGNKTCYEIY